MCHGGVRGVLVAPQGTEFLHHLRLDDAAKQHLLSMGRSAVLGMRSLHDH